MGTAAIVPKAEFLEKAKQMISPLTTTTIIQTKDNGNNLFTNQR